MTDNEQPTTTQEQDATTEEWAEAADLAQVGELLVDPILAAKQEADAGALRSEAMATISLGSTGTSSCFGTASATAAPCLSCAACTGCCSWVRRLPLSTAVTLAILTRGRPTGGAVRSGVFSAWRGQVHLRHGVFPAVQHRQGDRAQRARPADDGRGAAR